MSSEDIFNDKPLPELGAKDAAKASVAEHVFERSSASPATVIPSASSTDEFPDEPEPETEPMGEPEPLDAEFVEPQSSYGLSDPASLAAAGTGELHDPELATQQAQETAQATLGLAPGPTPDPDPGAAPSLALVVSNAPLTPGDLPSIKASQPHLAHLAQVGLTQSDTWDKQIKPRIEHLQGQILEINDRLDHLTTRKYR
ncbi:MAG: hypothetical protein HQ455_05375 [Burkholderiales bacterium]|nr:hypothetical protein [Burkholderiales bacterium]